MKHFSGFSSSYPFLPAHDLVSTCIYIRSFPFIISLSHQPPVLPWTSLPLLYETVGFWQSDLEFTGLSGEKCCGFALRLPLSPGPVPGDCPTYRALSMPGLSHLPAVAHGVPALGTLLLLLVFHPQRTPPVKLHSLLRGTFSTYLPLPAACIFLQKS